MEELGHNRSHDDDGRLALSLEALGEGHADGVVADRGHGREEEQFAIRVGCRIPTFSHCSKG